ncbi:hypothetical protein LINGRAHAP2_LOCUS34409 [Linum grandiflorum]
MDCYLSSTGLGSASVGK